MTDNPGEVLLEHYRDQLAEERSAKQAIERRGLGVIAADSALVALLFAFGDVDVQWGWDAAGVASGLLLSGVVVLAVSVGCGLMANRPEQYGVSDRLQAIAENDAVWTVARRSDAQQNVALDIAQIVDIAEQRNNTKGIWLLRAVSAQVGAVALLAATLLVNAAFVTP